MEGISSASSAEAGGLSGWGPRAPSPYGRTPQALWVTCVWGSLGTEGRYGVRRPRPPSAALREGERPGLLWGGGSRSACTGARPVGRRLGASGPDDPMPGRGRRGPDKEMLREPPGPVRPRRPRRAAPRPRPRKGDGSRAAPTAPAEGGGASAGRRPLRLRKGAGRARAGAAPTAPAPASAARALPPVGHLLSRRRRRLRLRARAPSPGPRPRPAPPGSPPPGPAGPGSAAQHAAATPAAAATAAALR